MKKQLGIALCLLLCIMSCLCMAEGTAEALPEGSTRLMVVTDMHYINPILYEESDLLARSAAVGDGKLPHRSDAWLEGLVLETLAQAPDALVLTGDQTFNGEVMSHRAVSDALARIQQAGIDVLVIPGNHDINNDNAKRFGTDGVEAIHSIPLRLYPKYYGEYGWPQAFSRDTASLSYVVALSDTLWLAMLDAGIFEPYAEAFGLIEADTHHWLEELLAQANEQGIDVITATHQSLLPHNEAINAGYMIINGDSLHELLAREGVRLNLSGHLHVQHIAEREGVYDISLTAFSMYPHLYAIVTHTPDGAIDYRLESLSQAHVPEGLLAESEAFKYDATYQKTLEGLQRVDGLTDAQREQMADFAARVNVLYYAGMVDTIHAQAVQEEAWLLWQEHGGDLRWHGYLTEMLGEMPRDMTILVLPSLR